MSDKALTKLAYVSQLRKGFSHCTMYRQWWYWALTCCVHAVAQGLRWLRVAESLLCAGVQLPSTGKLHSITWAIPEQDALLLVLTSQWQQHNEQEEPTRLCTGYDKTCVISAGDCHGETLSFPLSLPLSFLLISSPTSSPLK